MRARRASVRASVRHARSQRARTFGNRLARRSTEIAIIADAFWLKRPRPPRAQCSSLLSPSPPCAWRAMDADSAPAEVCAVAKSGCEVAALPARQSAPKRRMLLKCRPAAKATSSETSTGSAARPSKRLKAVSGDPESELQGVDAPRTRRGPHDLDAFTEFLGSNVLRCNELVLGKWKWVHAAPFIPFPRKQMPRVLAQNMHDICQALHGVIGLELLIGARQVPRAEVLATIMASTVGFTALWVKTLGMLPSCSAPWDAAWRYDAFRRLMRLYSKQTARSSACQIFNADITAIRSRSHLGAKSPKEARDKVNSVLLIVRTIWQAAPAARRAWMAGIKKGTAGVQVPVLKAFAVPNFPHLGYQQWLQHVTLQILCPAWEQARGEKWCRAMGSGVGIALGEIFEERPAQYDSDLELFDARLEQVTRYVRENWARLNDNGDSPPEFDEEDIAPQLCEWNRLGGPSECIDSPHTQFGRE